MMNKYHSLDPNGFLVEFYQNNQEIVRNEVSEVVMEFFRKGSLLKEWNTTQLVLIPKNSNAK